MVGFEPTQGVNPKIYLRSPHLTSLLHHLQNEGSDHLGYIKVCIISAGKIDFLFVQHIYAETLYAIEVVQLFLNVEKKDIKASPYVRNFKSFLQLGSAY